MKTWQQELPFHTPDSITLDCFTESSVFFDIETTGFSPAHTQVYLIGCAARHGNTVCVTQFFAEKPQEEKILLLAFTELLLHYDTVITFNGLGFDIPYLKGRCTHYQIPDPFLDFRYLDIFKSTHPYKKVLKLSSLKQKALEQFLGIAREDVYSGGDLINIYLDYTKSPNEQGRDLLKLHNFEDVTGMLELIPVLAYNSLFEGRFQVISYEKNAYEEYEGSFALELILTLKPYYPLPKRFSYGFSDIYITGFQDKVKLKVKIYQGELKYFYSNFQDYYYLPREDMAVHKSVAFYVDKDYRTKAKAATCYSKKTGCFLPQYEEIFTPYFKLEYHDKILYFEMAEEFTGSREAQYQYARHLMGVLLRHKK